MLRQKSMEQKTDKIRKKIGGTKSWLFEKINKVDTMPNSGMKEEAQSLNCKIKRIIYQICEEIYAKNQTV